MPLKSYNTLYWIAHTEMDITEIIKTQRFFFEGGTTKELSFRINALQKLKISVLKYEKEIAAALHQDLRKSEFESYSAEIGFILRELSYAIKHLKCWDKPECKKVPLFLFGSSAYIKHEPYGLTLILSPWNYPFQLLISPLIGAIAAGNCSILKPSPQSPHTNRIIQKLIAETFSPNYIAVYEADGRETEALLKNRFDFIFYTGGAGFGKRILEAAAKNLTPVTLELGGKSPCIIDEDANLSVAAQRIAWGKFMNCGQTCVAPDYLFVHTKIKEPFLDLLKSHITKQYGENPQESPDYGRIINESRFLSLLLLLKQGKIICGGQYDDGDLYIAPTVITGIHAESRIMDEEIFGPILPVIEYSDTDQILSFINSREKPLALYYFSENRNKAKFILNHTTSGGACINDVVVQVANTYLPFGGVGNSGMGSYHGKYSYLLFSHSRSIMHSSTRINITVKFAPYLNKLELLRKLLK